MSSIAATSPAPSLLTECPLFIFVPGPHLTPAHFDPILTSLRYGGYPGIAVALPNIGRGAATAEERGDAKAVRVLLEDLVLVQKRKVVMVCHAYGAIVGCQCVKSLDRLSIAQAGGDGGIIGLVLIAGLLADEGQSANTLLEAHGQTPMPWVDVDPAQPTVQIPNSRAAEFLFHDMDEYGRGKWARELRPMSTNFMQTGVMRGSWGFTLPRMYIVTTEDRCVWPRSQRAMLEARRHDEGWMVTSVRSGHVPFLSRVGDVSRLLVEFVERVEGMSAGSL